MRFSERQFNSTLKWVNCGNMEEEGKQQHFPPLSSQNLYRKRARHAESTQEEPEKLMRDETGTVCMCPCCGAGVLERGPGSRAFRLPRFAIFVVGFWVDFFCHDCTFFSTSFNLSTPLYFLTAAVIPTFSLLSFFLLLLLLLLIYLYPISS